MNIFSLIFCALFFSHAVGAAPAVPDGNRYFAVYLPGVYFAQLERKLELGTELSNYLSAKLGDSYRLTPRIYGDLAQMETDAAAGRIALGLIESPLVAARLTEWIPVCVATTASSETRLVVLAKQSVKSLGNLRTTHLVHAAPLDKPQGFFDNFVFEGVLSLAHDRLTASRDVASALSQVSLQKADAVLLYEGDEAQGQNIGLHALYRTTPLPRPTIVAFDKKISATELGRLRDALSQFQGRVHPGLRNFRPTIETPYQTLRTHMEQRPKRLPPLVELLDEQVPLPLPKLKEGTATQVPITAYAPPLEPL